MQETGSQIETDKTGNVFKEIAQDYLIHTGPSYGNNFFFTIGVYLLALFAVLVFTGLIMLLFGPYWWDLTQIGTFIRSIHLWAAESFVTLMFVHLFVNFSTSAFRKKRAMWVIGTVMLLLVLLEFAFGVGMGGSLIAQANQQAGADLWNGMGLGYWINPMNSGAVLGWHVAMIPIILMFLIFIHYSLVRKQGLNTPYRKDIPYSMVNIVHKTIYKRIAYILIIVFIMAVLFRAPYMPPLTIGQVAQSQPDITATTFLNEFNMSSPTATYIDTIDPYTFNTSKVYVSIPYAVYCNLTHTHNAESLFFAKSRAQQNATLNEAYSYFANNGTISGGMNSTNPLISVASSLTYMAQTGVYQQVLQGEVDSGLNTTYVIRFLFDTGALWNEAQKYGLSVPQWGMLEVGSSPQWALQYWLVPYNLLQIMTSGIPWWNDFENGSIAVLALLILMSLPYIPYLRDIPDKLGMYKIFWNRFTIPEMRVKGKKQKGKV